MRQTGKKVTREQAAVILDKPTAQLSPAVDSVDANVFAVLLNNVLAREFGRTIETFKHALELAKVEVAEPVPI
jgi:hypothetical protein